MRGTGLRVKAPRLRFFHNYLHDLEGLWWIAEWFFFNTYPGTRAATIMKSKKHFEARILAHSLFPSDARGSKERCNFTKDANYHDDIVDRLPEEYLEAARQMSDALEVMNNAAVFIEEDSARVSDGTAFVYVYDELSPLFAEAAKAAYDKKVVFITESPAQVEASAGVDTADDTIETAATKTGHDRAVQTTQRLIATRGSKRTHDAEDGCIQVSPMLASKKQKS